MKNPTERAAELLAVAAQYIRQHCDDATIFYDDTECDGVCLADDCEAAANALVDKGAA